MVVIGCGWRSGGGVVLWGRVVVAFRCRFMGVRSVRSGGVRVLAGGWAVVGCLG